MVCLGYQAFVYEQVFVLWFGPSRELLLGKPGPVSEWSASPRTVLVRVFLTCGYFDQQIHGISSLVKEYLDNFGLQCEAP